MKTIASTVLALGMFLPTVLFSQWQQTNGPMGGPVNSMTIDGTILFAGTDVGVYRSTNNGALWTDAALTNTSVNALYVNGTSVFAGTPIGAYRSTDHGLSWAAVNTGLTDLQVNAFGAGAGILYAGTYGGMFKSSNGGNTWVSTGALMPVISIEVTKDAAGASLVYAGCNWKSQNASGLFLSTDQGTTWTKLGAPTSKSFIAFDGELSVNRNVLYAGAITTGYPQTFFCDPAINPWNWQMSKVYLTENHWIGQASNPSPVGIVRYGWLNNSRMYVRAMDGHVYCESAGSFDWTDLGEADRPIVVESGTDIFFASVSEGIKKVTLSNFAGHPVSSSSPRNDGMLNGAPYALALFPGTGGNKSLIAATKLDNSIHSSSDRGVTWRASVKSQKGAINGLASVLPPGGGRIDFASSGGGLCRSVDGGSIWTELKLSRWDYFYPKGVVVLGGNVLTIDPWDLYRSSDYGQTWESFPHTLSGPNAILVGPTTSRGTSLFVTASKGLFRSTDIGTTWVKVGSPNPGNEPIIGFAANGSVLFALVSGLGIFRSYDDGDTWSHPANSGLHIAELTSLTTRGTRLFATNDGDGVFVSVDDGGYWTAINTGLTSLRAFSLAADSSELYVGTASGVLRYTGSLAPVANMTPTVSDLVAESTPFWVEVKIGDPNPVNNLAYISFQLSSNNPACQYVDSTAAYGPFLVKETIQGFRLNPTVLFSKYDAQTVSMRLQLPIGAKSGTGILAKAQFRTSGLVSTRDVTFSLNYVRAFADTGGVIELAPGYVTTHIVSGGAEVWPGDCNNNGVVDAADILPVGIYYGQILGMQNKPGITWQGFLREGWSGDSLRKKIHADANGDGFINSADVLAVGLNYGKTHQVVGVPGSVGLARSVADGLLQIGPYRKSQRSGELLTLPVSLKSTASVYGVAFNLKYGLIGSANTSSVRLLRIDTAGTAFGGGLMLNRISEEEGAADVGITRVHGNGFAGQDILMNLVFDAPSNSPVWVETSNVVGNDEKGNALNLAGSVFRSDAEGATEAASVPTENALLQNYPNPFNPATTISFQLSDVSAVSLKVFDILGREIVTLVNEEKPAGSFMVRWDATGVPSGIYCFQMTARNKSGQVFTQTRRMTIVK